MRAPLAAMLLALAFLASAASARTADDFRITLLPGTPPVFTGEGVQGELVNQSADQLAWRLTTNKTHLFGTITSLAYFAAERPRQVVPESKAQGIPDDDWHFFIEVQDVEGRAEWARAVNYTMFGGNLTMRLALPVNASTHEAVLRLTLDKTPPNFSIGQVQNITHFSFYIETATSEYTLADLKIRPVAGGEEVRNPTALYALLQRFPVQGLNADKDYLFYVEFEDWAQNLARSGELGVRTLPKPDLPKANITAFSPGRDATVPEPVGLIVVNFTGPAPKTTEHVRVFVDKVPLQEGVQLFPDHLEIRPPAALGPGRHSVGVELTSPEGGVEEEHWSFTVAKPAPFPAWSLAALAALLLAAKRRRA